MDNSIDKILTILDDIETAVTATFTNDLATRITFFTNETIGLKTPFTSVFYMTIPFYYDKSDACIGEKNFDIEFAVMHCYKWDDVKSDTITKPQQYIIPIIKTLTNTLFATDSFVTTAMFAELTSIDLDFQDEPNTGYDAFLVTYKLETEISNRNV